MKNKVLIVFCVLILNVAGAQNKKAKQNINANYKRSSLHTILIESDNFPYKDEVINAYYNSPFPDKYNNHTIGEKSFDPKDYGKVENDTMDFSTVIRKYLDKNKIAHKMLAKWFNRQPNGSFNMDLIAQRGEYDATEMEAHIASNSVRGVASLADAGEELIGNTFVVVSRLSFISNELPARLIRETAVKAANEIEKPLVRLMAIKAADIAYNKAKKGYSVWTNSYLYQLEWNDSIASIFYSDYWMATDNFSEERKNKFDQSDLFKLKYLGNERSRNLVTFSLKKKRSEEEIVRVATTRNIDAVYAKLQKKHDVFKTKTPLYSGFPITAKIGLKEGLEPGDRYEVLEKFENKNGITKYRRKGVISVQRGKIWDNRFNAGDGLRNKKKNSKGVDRTYFKGTKNYHAGMLIRQIKK